MKPLMPVPCLCLVTDRRLGGSDLAELERRVAGGVKGGVNVVQLREKDLPGGRLLDLAKRLRRITDGSALLLINERVDVAVACDGDGLQLGEEAMPLPSARKAAGDDHLLGRSVHSLTGAIAAEGQGADFLVIGPTFATESHTAVEAAGLQLLSQVAGETRIPLVGIGGIDAARVHEVIGAGASGVAVIRAILAAGDPERAARELRDALDAAWHHFHGSRQASAVTPRRREDLKI